MCCSFIHIPVQLCKPNRVNATCANATLDMNYNSSFSALTLLQTLLGRSCACMHTPFLAQSAPRHHEKILRRNPLKTSEISKLLKSNYKPELCSFRLIKPKPLRLGFKFSIDSNNVILILVEPGGIEPPTSCVQGRRSPS